MKKVMLAVFVIATSGSLFGAAQKATVAKPAKKATEQFAPIKFTTEQLNRLSKDHYARVKHLHASSKPKQQAKTAQSQPKLARVGEPQQKAPKKERKEITFTSKQLAALSADDRHEVVVLHHEAEKTSAKKVETTKKSSGVSRTTAKKTSVTNQLKK